MIRGLLPLYREARLLWLFWQRSQINPMAPQLLSIVLEIAQLEMERTAP